MDVSGNLNVIRLIPVASNIFPSGVAYFASLCLVVKMGCL